MPFTEDTFEQAVIELFEHMGYSHVYAPDMDRDYTSPLLDTVLRDSLVRINKGLPVDAIDEAITKLKNFDNGPLLSVFRRDVFSDLHCDIRNRQRLQIDFSRTCYNRIEQTFSSEEDVFRAFDFLDFN